MSRDVGCCYDVHSFSFVPILGAQFTALTIVWEWVRAVSPPPWSDCASLSPELRSWHLQFGNLSIDLDGHLWRRRAPPAMALQLVVPADERRGFIYRYHDSIFAGHLGVTRTVCQLLDRVY